MIELLTQLCTAKGVSGDELSVSQIIEKEISKYAESVVIDRNNNVLAIIGDTTDHNIMLDAHIDEIGFVVTYIDDEGFIKVSSCGGMDYRVVQDTRFKIITEKQEISAVVCCMPPHLSDGGEDKAPCADSIYLDTGLTASEVKEMVGIGDFVAFDVTPVKLMNNRFSCCSTDNRAGCAVLLRTAQMLKEDPANTGVTFAFTSQEETYGKGAMTSAYSVNPDEAISIDVSFAQQKGVSEVESGKLGEGAMICISPVLSKKIYNKLIALANKHEIPYQIEVTGGITGTNGDKISVTRSGIPTAVVSIPQRNMHTPAEIISIDDIENTARLLFEYIKEAY